MLSVNIIALTNPEDDPIGPQRAVPLFLLGGGAFTIFTFGALLCSGGAVLFNPILVYQTAAIVERLEAENLAHITETVQVLSIAVFFQFCLRSMSSAMLGFSGYEW